jgi:hypothetical protein
MDARLWGVLSFSEFAKGFEGVWLPCHRRRKVYGFHVTAGDALRASVEMTGRSGRRRPETVFGFFAGPSSQ